MNTPRIFLIITVLLSLVAGSSGEAFASSSTPAAQAQPVVSRLDDGLSLAWQIPDASVSPQPDGTVLVRLPGFDTLQDSGSLALPTYSTLIALPVGAAPSLEIVEAATVPLSLAQPLAANPREELTKADGSPLALQGAQAQPALKLAELEPVGDLRGVPLARLTLHPVLPQAGGVLVARQVKLVIHFNSGVAPQSKASPALQAELAGLVLNPEDLSLAPAAALAPQRVSAVQAGQAAIEVASEGVYRITYAALSGIGFAVASANPHNLHLARAGVEIAYEWEGNADNVFDPGESLVFYALPRVNRWSNTDVYFLSASATPGTLVASASATIAAETPGTAWFEQTFEQNGFYTPDFGSPQIPTGRDGDRWVWDEAGVQRIGVPSATRSFAFSVNNANFVQPSTLTIWLIGFTDSPQAVNHRVQVKVNNAVLGTLEWKGKLAQSATFPVPAGTLQTANNLTLTLPGITGVDVEGVWLDAFSLKYQAGSATWTNQAVFSGSGGSGKYYQAALAPTGGLRIYDVTNASAPVRLTGATVNGSAVSFADKAGSAAPRFYLTGDAGIQAPAAMHLVSALKTAGVTGADYVIVAPNAFAGGLASLVALRNSQGLVTVVEDLQAIFDQYGEGIPQPAAIQAYLQDVNTRWNPKPLYALLVGDGTSDPKQYFPEHFKSIIPPYLADFDPFTTEGATDNLYVTFGGPSDVIPDMLIGRLPVNSTDELAVVVNKIVQYETSPAPGNWKNNATFLAARPDTGGDFLDAASNESALLTWTVPVNRIFYPSGYASVPDAKAALLSRWNGGTGLLVFNGHAGIHQWATRDASANFAEFIHVNDIPSLTNGSKLPVVLSMTCYTGAFQTPGLSVFDETVLRAANGGAVATWGATGLGTTAGHEFLARGFIDRLTAQTGTRLGQAALAGKLLLLAKRPSMAYLLDSFNLMGDPATILSFAKTQKTIFVPIATRE